MSSWQDALGDDDRRLLHRRYPELSLDEIALEELKNPKYARAFELAGARVVTYEEAMAEHERYPVGVIRILPIPEWFPRVEVPRESWERFVALLLLATEPASSGTRKQGARDRERSDADEIARLVIEKLVDRKQRKPPKPGPKEVDPPRATKQKVVRLHLDGEPNAEIERQTKLGKHVVARLVREIDEVLGPLRAGRY